MSKPDRRAWEATPEDIAKLPQWAQKYVHGLENQVRYLNGRVAELSAGPEDSRVRAHSYHHPDVKLGDATVRFFLGESREQWEDMVEVRVRGGVLVIDTHGAGRHVGLLRPVSSNAHEVLFVDRP